MTPQRRRLLFALIVVALWVGGIAARLWALQVRDHEAYRRRAERQQQRVVELDPPRGAIYDARGRELAVSVEVDSAYAVPREVADPRATAAAVARVVGLDRARLERHLASDREFVWVARKLDPPRAGALRRLGLAGVYFLPESRRYYPLREIAAPVLGYVGTDNHGLAGLEAAFDAEIAGRPGRRTVLRDARAGTLLHPDGSFADAEPGADLHLTLDASIQYLLERELERGAVAHRARSASAVLLDPRTGAVLAMASYPSFDPNRFAAVPAERWRNRPVADAFEPGSTFKLITAAAAIEAGLLSPEDTIDCEMGGITLASVHISDHRPFGLLTFRQVITKSSNVGAIKIGLLVGEQRLYRSLRAFGFGRPTGIDLPGESPGIVRPVERWPPLAKAYIAFGQGLSVTPLQLAVAFAAIANDGTVMRPYVVAATGRGETRQPRRPGAETVGRAASPATVRVLQSMLAEVVAAGTGKAAAVPGYGVGGKTGTAQKAIAGGYSPDRHVASFVGFAPLRAPILAGVVVVDEPRGAYHGGEVAAPIFGAVAREVLLYLGVPPEREPPATWPRQPAPPEPESVLAAWTATEDAEPAPVAALRVVAAGLLAPPAVAPPPAGPTVPDLVGLSAREAVRRTSDLGLRPVLDGQGVVARQEPAPGAPLPAAGERIRLWLRSGTS